MARYFSLFSLIAILFLASCGSSKKTRQIEKENKQMTEEGFKKGIVVSSNIEGDCPYTIKILGEESLLFDPVNLDENYKKEGMLIWIKYTGMRMANRCTKANPITVNQIQKRTQ